MILYLVFLLNSRRSIQTVFRNKKSSCLAPCKEMKDSLGLWFPRHGFRIPGIRFQSLLVELGFWISIVSGILDSLRYIPDSKAQNSTFQKQNFPDSGFYRQNLPDLGIQIPFHGAKCQ